MRRTASTALLLAAAGALTVTACGQTEVTPPPAAASTPTSSSTSPSVTTTEPATETSTTSESPSSTTSESPTSSAAPTTATGPIADGSTITGTGYSFNSPKGWTDLSSRVPSADVAVGDAQDKDGFADNINVIKTAGSSSASLSLIESTIAAQQKKAGGKDVKVETRTTIAGEEAAHVTGSFAASSPARYVEQFYVAKGDTAYVITYSTSPTVQATARDTVINPVLASWTWTS